MFPEEITKEQVAELPVIRFSGKAHVLSSAKRLRRVLDSLADEPYVGFDTETKPNFKKGQFNKVALLQFATGSEAYLIRVQSTQITDDVLRFLESPIPKLGIAVHDDIKALQRLRGFDPGGFVSVNQITAELGIKNQGIQALSAILLGGRISKRQQLSNWENEHLTPAQINYAATDAWVCWKMYRTLADKGYV